MRTGAVAPRKSDLVGRVSGRSSPRHERAVGFRDPPDPRRRRARPGDRRPGRADLPDDQLPVPRHEHAANLFALAEVGNVYTRIMNPTQARARGAAQRARGRRDDGHRPARRAGRRLGPGGRDAGHPQPRQRRRPHRVVGVALRRHLQPVPLHAAQDGHRRHLRRRSRRPRPVAGRGARQHEGVLRRDASPTRRTTSSTSRASPASPTTRACR